MNKVVRCLLVGVGASFLIGLLVAPSWAAKSGYSASQTGSVLQVRTPFGSTLYLAQLGFEQLDHYKFEIPLSALREQIKGTENSKSTSTGDPSESDKGGNSPKPSEIADTDSLVAQANSLYNRGQFSQALSYVDELLRRDPKNSRGWTMKGSLMHVLGHKDLAKQSWKKALELDPKNESLKNIVGGAP